MEITGKARLAAVIGDPIEHSLSPVVHNHWFRECQIDGVYVPIRSASADFADSVRTLARLGFCGFNITIPHKEAAFALADKVDENASLMQAVNTLLVRGDGSLFGCNTDGMGFLANLAAAAPGRPWKDGIAAIMGAGGAAKAIAVALVQDGIRCLRIANRDRKRSERLASMISGLAPVSIDVFDWQMRNEALEGANLLVNATSLGMRHAPELQVNTDKLPRHAVVNDIVYNPLETELLRTARRNGHLCVDGLGMLLHQAVPGFQHWGGQTPTVDSRLQEIVLRQLGL